MLFKFSPILSDNNQRAVYDDIIGNGEQRSNYADTAASNSKMERGKLKEKSRNAENLAENNWSKVRAAHSERGERSTQENYSIFGSVLLMILIGFLCM